MCEEVGPMLIMLLCTTFGMLYCGASWWWLWL